MIDLGLVLRAAVALVFVLALIAGATWLTRRYFGSAVFTGLTGQNRIGIVQSLNIDGRSRLVLLRRDDAEHLIVVGPSGATVVEANIPVAPSSGKEREAKEQGSINLRAIGRD